MNTVMKRRLGATLTAIALTAGGLGVAGCGGDSTAASSATAATTATTGTAAADNGIASLGAQEILAKATDAANGASSVRIAGNIDQDGQQVSLDLTVAQNAADGTLGIKGQQVEVRLVGGKFYMRAPAAFYESLGQAGGATIGQLVGGKWFSVPLDNSETAQKFASLQAFTDKNKLFDSLLNDAQNATVKGPGDVGGQPVVLLDDAKGGTLAVATTGEPYPLQVSGSGDGNSGTLNFTDWNAPVNVTAPADALDIGALLAAGDTSTTTSTDN